MRIKTTVFNAIIFLAFAAVLAVSVACSAATMSVKADKISGKVEMKPSASGAWTALKNGDSVAVGATVRTGPGASCMLKWAGGNVVKLSPLTTMTVSQAEKAASGKESSRIDISGGRVSAHAKAFATKDSSFNVKTPTAVAGVRGTDLYVEVNDAGVSSIGVTDGNVEVESGDSVVVIDEGQFVIVEEMGIVPPPEPVPVETLQELKQEFNVINDEAKQDAETSQGDNTGGAQGTTGAQGDAGGQGGTGAAEAGANSADANSSVDTVMNQQDINNVVDSIQNEQKYLTGDVEVEIHY